MSQIGLLPNTADETETSLDFRQQEAHVDDGILTKLLETHCLYLCVCTLSLYIADECGSPLRMLYFFLC